MKSKLVFLSVLLLFTSGCVHTLQNGTSKKAATSPSVRAQQVARSTSPTQKNAQTVQTKEGAGEIQNAPEKSLDPTSCAPGNSELGESLKFCEKSQVFWQKGELDQALEALDQAYALLLKVEPEDDDPELMKQKEDLRFMISKRILEIHASRNTSVKGKHDAIPMVMNPHVQAEIDRLTKGMGSSKENFFIRAYRRSGKYRPYILKELKKAGLPKALSWLPLIESGYQTNALSRARALGLWQFIPSTGYKFGLKRNRYIDERLDFEKSTRAAIAYLKELHQIFGDWSTVLAAYNCGEARVLREIRKQNINYLDNFWDLYEQLPQETARYVPRFIATLHMVKNKEKYGLSQIQVADPLAYETVPVSKQTHLKNIAALIGISADVLEELNPELRHKTIPGKAYPLRVPPQSQELLVAKLKDLPTTAAPKWSRTHAYHKVKRGETLSIIANRYHTSVNTLVKVNRIRNKRRLSVGKVLKIPRRGTVRYASSQEKPKKKVRAKRTFNHVVKKGETLWHIAQRYGIELKTLVAVNQMRSTRLSVGEVLKIPGTKERRKYDLRVYRVKHGDVPFEIAKRYKMPLDRFLEINHLKPNSKIYPGQKLYVD